mmetsp:Transcript_54325/g.86352  ORF Transcript_54325/g.86352 Transcript_54325/m.86352 type:complete len:283 (-) Transcript_54325:174-1022(-)
MPFTDVICIPGTTTRSQFPSEACARLYLSTQPPAITSTTSNVWDSFSHFSSRSSISERCVRRYNTNRNTSMLTSLESRSCCKTHTQYFWCMSATVFIVVPSNFPNVSFSSCPGAAKLAPLCFKAWWSSATFPLRDFRSESLKLKPSGLPFLLNSASKCPTAQSSSPNNKVFSLALVTNSYVLIPLILCGSRLTICSSILAELSNIYSDCVLSVSPFSASGCAVETRLCDSSFNGFGFVVESAMSVSVVASLICSGLGDDNFCVSKTLASCCASGDAVGVAFS